MKIQMIFLESLTTVTRTISYKGFFLTCRNKLESTRWFHSSQTIGSPAIQKAKIVVFLRFVSQDRMRRVGRVGIARNLAINLEYSLTTNILWIVGPRKRSTGLEKNTVKRKCDSFFAFAWQKVKNFRYKK